MEQHILRVRSFNERKKKSVEDERDTIHLQILSKIYFAISRDIFFFSTNKIATLKASMFPSQVRKQGARNKIELETLPLYEKSINAVWVLQ